MNILVTGANGQLGNELRIVARGLPDKYVFTDVVEQEGQETMHLDITDIEAIRALVKQEAIDVIVNCAAYTNVDKAETDADLAELLNAKAPQNLAVAMKEAGGLLVHISTDYVFGKERYNTPCREDMVGTTRGDMGYDVPMGMMRRSIYGSPKEKEKGKKVKPEDILGKNA